MSIPFGCSRIHYGVGNATMAKKVGPNRGEDARRLPKRYNAFHLYFHAWMGNQAVLH